MNDLSNTFKTQLNPIFWSEAEVLRHIATWDDLELKRGALESAVRTAMKIQAAVALSDHGPPRFTCEALNKTLWVHAPACYGMNSKRSFNNMLSLVRTVLIRCGELDVKTDLTPAWQGFHGRLPTHERKLALIRFMRFCSAMGIEPWAVDAGALDAFEVWCLTRQLLDDVGGLVRRSASNWNWAKDNVAGWPQVTLTRSDMRDHYSTPLTATLPSFQAEVKSFLDGKAADPVDRLFTGSIFAITGHSPRSRPQAAKPRTIQLNEDSIRAAYAALLVAGWTIETIQTLRDLIEPAAVEAIFKFHHARRRAREKKQVFKTRPGQLQSIIETLRQIAKFHCRIPEEALGIFKEMRAAIAPPAQTQMTDTNWHRTKALLEENTYAKMLHLSPRWQRRVEGLRSPKPNAKGITPKSRPLEAARLMLFAVVHEILLYCPMRRHNVVNLHLTEDIIRSQGRITAVRINGDQTNKTKTGSVIDWPVPASVIDMINVWIKVYRPLLAEEGNPYLFPGMGQHARNGSEFGSYFSKLVEREIGAEFNMHVARHFAVVRYLRKHPGQYAVMSRVLGHKKVDFTIRFYSGLEINAAAVSVNKAVQVEKATTKHAAAAAYRPRQKPGKAKPATASKATDIPNPPQKESK